jgi:Diphthamide synthase
LWKRS